jgi:TolB-like protein
MTDPDAPWSAPALAATASGAAVLVAQMAARHALTPLHAEAQCRQAAEMLSASLAEPPRERLWPLPGVGLALTAHDTQALVDAARRLPWSRSDHEARAAFRLGVHAVGDARAPQAHELQVAERVAAAAPTGGMCLSAEAVDRLTQAWALPLRDAGPARADAPDGLHLFHLPTAGDAAPAAPPVPLLTNTVAVLPPALSGRDERHAAVADMVADALIVTLSRSSQWHVISGRSSAGLRHSRQAMADAFAHLGVHHVLHSQGSLGLNDRVFLQLAMFERDRPTPVWQERVDFDLVDLLYGDAFALTQAATDLHAVLQNAALSASKTVAWERVAHYQLLSAATQQMHRLSASGLDEADALLAHLAAQMPRGPQGAEPRAWRAYAHLLRGVQGRHPLAEAAQAVQEQALAALDLAPEHALAHTLLGHARSIQGVALDEAAQCHRTALQHDPNCALAWAFLALNQTYADAPADAVESAQLALALSPLDPWRYFLDSVLAHALLANQQNEAALVHAENALRQRASHAPTLLYLTLACTRLGRTAQAQQALAQLRQLWPVASVSGFRNSYWGREAAHADDFARTLAQAGLPP